MIEQSVLESGTIKILEFILNEALKLNASDIHIDPTEDSVRLRFRIDGVLRGFYEISKEKHLELISRIKILTGLRVDEHFKAQDGRFRFKLITEKYVDIRVSILPTYFGENAVFRLLAGQDKTLLKTLGFSVSDLDKISTAFNKTNGMILVTGPTGCGKTTTLYSIIRELNKEKDSIITIEDPIEYAVPGVRQIQVDKYGSLNFANGLRSILRQDPNIIMVGEIRDNETASMSVNAALTGHLLLSTLHTNDASSALPRLIDMRIEPFLLASTFSIAINQRLVKKNCGKCLREVKKSEDELLGYRKFFGELVPSRFYESLGCDDCDGLGYKGRTVIAEALVMSEEIRYLILKKTSAREVRKKAVEEGMTTLLADGLEKAQVGTTTLEEVLRVVNE